MGSLITALGNSSRALFQAVLSAPQGFTFVQGGRLARLSSLVALFSRSDEAAESLLEEKFTQLQIHGELSDYETRALSRLRDLITLRALTFGKLGQGKKRLRQAFVLRNGESPDFDTESLPLSTQDITESATVVADLYWKLYQTCLGAVPELQPVGLQLYYHIFGVPFRAQAAGPRIANLVENIQRDQGIGFLILNLLKQGAFSEARTVGRHLLTAEIDFADEETASVLYWLVEVSWFARAWALEKLTHETTLRFLYHLCFTNPDRAGFLEIDSPFFSEFATVNEMAREALIYQETLVDGVLNLWTVYEGDFDSVFQKSLEAIAGRVSKIYDQRASWEKLWKRNRESFSRDYLYVVEGNLCYASGLYPEAAECYETALALSPQLRPALLNLVFAYAHCGREQDLRRLIDRIVEANLGPAALYVAGNAFLLVGDPASAEPYFQALKELPGWQKKVDHYRSTFCYQNELFELALEFALLAHKNNPTDVAVAYHLSLCHNAVGQKDAALNVLRGMEGVSGWLRFYQFTLERDLGDYSAATETLRQIPTDYFEDPEEFEVAMSYARQRQDISLLRHLKNKKS